MAYFEFFTEMDVLVISAVFNVACIFYVSLLKLLRIFYRKKLKRNKSDKIENGTRVGPPLLQQPQRTIIRPASSSIKPHENSIQRREHLLYITTYRITQQILLIVTVILGCICLNEDFLFAFPFVVPHNNIPQLLKFTFNVNIGRYFFLAFGNLLIAENSKFPAIFIHHLVTICTYVTISSFKQNMLLGLLGIFMEMSTLTVTVGRVLKDTKRYLINIQAYYTFVIISCDLTFLFRGLLPILCLAVACSRQNPFLMDGFPLVIFFMSVFFFGIINIWMMFQAFYTLKLAHMKRMSLKATNAVVFAQQQSSSKKESPPRTLSERPLPLSLFNQLTCQVKKSLTKTTERDFLKSTRLDGKIIIFENNLSAKAAQHSEKNTNVTSDTRTSKTQGVQQRRG